MKSEIRNRMRKTTINGAIVQNINKPIKNSLSYSSNLNRNENFKAKKMKFICIKNNENNVN